MYHNEDKEFIKEYLAKDIKILTEMYDGTIDLTDRLLIQGSLNQAEKMFCDLFKEASPIQPMLLN